MSAPRRMRAEHRRRLRSAEKAITRAHVQLRRLWADYQQNSYASYWDGPLNASDLATAIDNLERASKATLDLIYGGRS